MDLALGASASPTETEPLPAIPQAPALPMYDVKMNDQKIKLKLYSCKLEVIQLERLRLSIFPYSTEIDIAVCRSCQSGDDVLFEQLAASLVHDS